MSADITAQIRAEVERYGWHVVLVPKGEDGEPPFGFTVGLTQTFAHPELIAIGLDAAETDGLMHQLLDAAAESVEEGARYAADQVDEKLLVDYRVTLREVARKHFPTWLAFLTDYYGGEDAFRCLQIVWPDRKRRFPWDEGFEEGIRARQPLLDR